MTILSLQYIVKKSKYFGGCFEVREKREYDKDIPLVGKTICICSLESDAERIARVLNREVQENWEVE